MPSTNCSCGATDVRYYRSRDGGVVHRSTCVRRGKTSVEWHYASTHLDNDHNRVIAEVERVPWLRSCGYCMTQGA